MVLYIYLPTFWAPQLWGMGQSKTCHKELFTYAAISSFTFETCKLQSGHCLVSSGGGGCDTRVVLYKLKRLIRKQPAVRWHHLLTRILIINLEVNRMALRCPEGEGMVNIASAYCMMELFHRVWDAGCTFLYFRNKTRIAQITMFTPVNPVGGEPLFSEWRQLARQLVHGYRRTRGHVWGRRPCHVKPRHTFSFNWSLSSCRSPNCTERNCVLAGHDEPRYAIQTQFSALGRLRPKVKGAKISPEEISDVLVVLVDGVQCSTCPHATPSFLVPVYIIIRMGGGEEQIINKCPRQVSDAWRCQVYKYNHLGGWLIMVKLSVSMMMMLMTMLPIQINAKSVVVYSMFLSPFHLHRDNQVLCKEHCLISNSSYVGCYSAHT